jgi:hypothetical protein
MHVFIIYEILIRQPILHPLVRQSTHSVINLHIHVFVQLSSCNCCLCLLCNFYLFNEQDEKLLQKVAGSFLSDVMGLSIQSIQ